MTATPYLDLAIAQCDQLARDIHELIAQVLAALTRSSTDPTEER